VLWVAGCGLSSYRVDTFIEPDSTVVDRMIENQIGLEGEVDYFDYAVPGVNMEVSAVERVCFLNASRHRRTDGTSAYYLAFSYTGPDQLMIEKRPTMELIIDGAAPITLDRHGDVTRIRSELDGSFTESCDYEVTAHALKTITGAKSVRVLVTGTESKVQGYFTRANFDNFKRFVDSYVR
jgi:hypothetical protein